MVEAVKEKMKEIAKYGLSAEDCCEAFKSMSINASSASDDYTECKCKTESTGTK